MREEVALREWCLEKALVVEHINSSRTLDVARRFEDYILGKPQLTPDCSKLEAKAEE